MRKIRPGAFNTIAPWNYPRIYELICAAEGLTVSTNGEFDDVLIRARKSEQVCVIEARVDREDTSSKRPGWKHGNS